MKDEYPEQILDKYRAEVCKMAIHVSDRNKYIYPINGITAHKLPSTSPANAGYSLERLVKEWKEIA